MSFPNATPKRERNTLPLHIPDEQDRQDRTGQDRTQDKTEK